MEGSQDARGGVATRLLGYLCAALVAFMAFAMSVQVIARYALHNPPDWTEELARVAFVYATFVGAALAVQRRAHLGVDLFGPALSIRGRALLQMFWRLLACVALGVITWYGYKMSMRLSSQPLTSVPISKGFAFAGVPVGCALMLVYELGRIAHEARKYLSGVDPDHESVLPRADFIVETHEDVRP